MEAYAFFLVVIVMVMFFAILVLRAAILHFFDAGVARVPRANSAVAGINQLGGLRSTDRSLETFALVYDARLGLVCQKVLALQLCL